MNSVKTTKNHIFSGLSSILQAAPVILALVSFNTSFANNNINAAGILDEPISTSSEQDTQAVRVEVKKEQIVLENLERSELSSKAEGGERLAQVALGNDFAKEAADLVNIPIAANDALSDAIAWFSLAAQRGFPGAASLDSAGVSFYPIRAFRGKKQ